MSPWCSFVIDKDPLAVAESCAVIVGADGCLCGAVGNRCAGAASRCRQSLPSSSRQASLAP
jgi:hypothetical protein